MVETVESRAAILNLSLAALSTQQLLSCDTASQYGCSGGLPRYAFDWLMTVGVGLGTGTKGIGTVVHRVDHPHSAECSASGDRAGVPFRER